MVIACLAWPIVTRISSAPRWLFFRMAVLVTLVLWLPDLYILANGEPPRAVAVLMAMHLAIAAVTYNCLVRIARVEPAEAARRPASDPDRYVSRRMWRAGRCTPRLEGPGSGVPAWRADDFRTVARLGAA